MRALSAIEGCTRVLLDPHAFAAEATLLTVDLFTLESMTVRKRKLILLAVDGRQHYNSAARARESALECCR